MRIGYGYDVHAFEAGSNLVLGGVSIPYDKKFKAHSDGDVLLHSICDALLGALAKGDIGQHFPDNDPEYKGISSIKLLERCMEIVRSEGYDVGNIDSTIAMQKPKLMSYILQMQENIAVACGVDVNKISVKATTTEKLGFVGEEKGAEAYAVVLLEKLEN